MHSLLQIMRGRVRGWGFTSSVAGFTRDCIGHRMRIHMLGRVRSAPNPCDFGWDPTGLMPDFSWRSKQPQPTLRVAIGLVDFLSSIKKLICLVESCLLVYWAWVMVQIPHGMS